MMAPALPATLAPPAPFPLVVAQSQSNEPVAPGIRRGTYRLQTVDGPLVVEVVAIDPSEPTVRLGAVLANDRLVSPGESVSSMARRTNAVAGINADYFDIGQTNQPLNVVVRDGALVRTPSKRIALDVRRDHSIHFDNFSFSGSVQDGAARFPLTSVNEWPPQGGVALLTPSYGALQATTGVTLATIVPGDAAHETNRIDGTYRVAALGAPLATGALGFVLAFGPAALALGPPPNVGDDVTLATSVVPALDDVLAAVGGGPLLVRDGGSALDPNAPAPEERDVRFPVAGAMLAANGTLVLVSVDGRQAALSIGVTRPQFAALMLGLGATDGMAFDSGGSATLVARALGDATASVLNVPSDGAERPVADGLFAYSDAPQGPATTLVVRPSPIVALPHVDVPIRVAMIDAAGHALGVVHPAGGDSVRGRADSFEAVVRARGLTARIPVRIVKRLAHLALAGDVRPERGATVRLTAIGTDDRSAPVALGSAVHWSANRGGFIAPGLYRAADRDARIVARAGGLSAQVDVRVGRHRVALPIFDAAHAPAWRFATAPANASGSLDFDDAGSQLRLAYDFTSGERAAYATAAFAQPLPGEPFSFTVDVDGDGSGVGLRAAFVNRFGERRALTLAKSVAWNGWQSQTIELPDDLNPPVRLVALYAVPSLGGDAVRARGTLGFRNPSVVIAGTP